MDLRIYHGNLKPIDLAQPLMAHFNRGNLRVQQFGNEDHLTVQIATITRPASGGQTAISIQFKKVSDGVSVQVGQQAWMGIAASIGVTALSLLRNPFSIIGRLDDIAQDIENIQLTDEVWNTLDAASRSIGVGLQLSERLQRTICNYCGTANEINAGRCIACGAPMGGLHPSTCLHCGFVLKSQETVCPNCSQKIN